LTALIVFLNIISNYDFNDNENFQCKIN